MLSLRASLSLVLAAFAWLGAMMAHAGVTAWVPLEIRDGKVLFPVEVGGVSGHAVFDTGSQGNSVSSALVERAGLALAGRRFSITGIGSKDEIVSSVSSLPIKLFGIDFKLQEVPALPHDEALIIGAGFLKASVLQLDYPNSRMRLITHDSVDLSKVANVPMRLEAGSGLPAVQVTIDGKDRWMLLDTGNTGPIVMRRLVASESNWIERFKRADAAVVDINANVSSMDLLVLPSIVIGPFELADVPVMIPAVGEGINISGVRGAGAVKATRIQKGVRISGIIGYEVLRHFVATIDYDRQKFHIAAPPEEPEKPAQAAVPPDESAKE